MINSFDWDDYKRMEYLGDGLYNFLCREVILEEYTTHKKAIVFFIQSNSFQAAVAIKIGLTPPANVFDTIDVYGNNSPYPYSNELEVHIYRQFLIGGYGKAKEFFIENILPYCQTIQDAKAFEKQKVIPKHNC